MTARTYSRTDPNRLLGATVRATNLTHGLRPAQPWGEPETVTAIVDPRTLLIETAEGSLYSNGGFVVIHWAEGVTIE
jgi:hypothetical protein